MRFAQRLKKLEDKWRVAGTPGIPWEDDGNSGQERTDEEEADLIGQLLWLAFRDEDWLRSQSSLDSEEAWRQWNEAVAQARRQGHTSYHAGLRPWAMPLWLRWKKSIMTQRRTHGAWIWDDPPGRLETLSREEFQQLDVGDKISVLREANQRRGHWKKAS